MKQAAPGKILVVFWMAKRVMAPGSEDLQPPWACEVSALPRKGDAVAYFDASTPRHPERRPWKRVDMVRGEKVVSWGWGPKRQVYIVTGPALYVPDLDVFMIPVERRDDRERGSKIEGRLHELAQALDIDEPPAFFGEVVLGKEKET